MSTDNKKILMLNSSSNLETKDVDRKEAIKHLDYANICYRTTYINFKALCNRAMSRTVIANLFHYVAYGQNHPESGWICETEAEELKAMCKCNLTARKVLIRLFGFNDDIERVEREIEGIFILIYSVLENIKIPSLVDSANVLLNDTVITEMKRLIKGFVTELSGQRKIKAV